MSNRHVKNKLHLVASKNFGVPKFQRTPSELKGIIQYQCITRNLRVQTIDYVITKLFSGIIEKTANI